MKVGTIIRNHWAGDRNPTRFFIYLGSSGKYVNGLGLVNGRLEKVRFYKSDFKDKNMFEIVGYSTGIDVLKNDIKSYLEENNESR